MTRSSAVRSLNEQRALVGLALLFVFLSLFAPNFLSVHNVTTILKGATLNGIVAIGFTIAFILGQLDLSVGAVVMLCGMLAIGLQPQWGWPLSVLLSIAAGAAVGLVNGVLVVKAKIHSFIVTLGTMTIVTGIMHTYSQGGSKSIDDFTVADWLDTAVLPFFPPKVLIAVGLVLGFSFFLNHTVTGRRFFIVGGNPETAWLAGLNGDRTLMAGFVLCSTMAATGGILFAMSLSAMTSAAVVGMRTLMTVLAAVIIGGTLMSGGKGSVIKSFFAVLLLTTLFNGIGCFGLGFEVQIFANGVILALVVLYEAFAIYRYNLLKGQRPYLKTLPLPERERTTGEEEEMNDKDRFALICLSIVAVVAIVAIFAMVYLRMDKREAVPWGGPGSQTAPLAESQKVDVYQLKGTDGQPYILPHVEAKTIPPRPEDPKLLPETDKGHWWDIEYAGWEVEKSPMPESPRDGSRNKRVVLLKAGDHPYWTAYVKGFTALAEAYEMDVKIFNSNWNVDLQAQQTDQAINERPDMIIFAPVDATACTPLLRKINKAGVPCIASNTIPCDEAMRYCLAWTGPDDWGQFRLLARAFADAMGKQGGYAIVRHMPGSSPFFARTYAPITELKQYAPGMQLLTMDTSNLEAERTMQLVSAWLAKFGTKLRGLVLAGDGFVLTGTLEAIRNAGREDVILVAAGNSKTGMDSIKAGEALAITYQSAEGDGALAVHTAARWFEGERIDPVNYLPKHLITREDVEEYMPAQW